MAVNFPFLSWDKNDSDKIWQWPDLPSCFRQLLLSRHIGFCSENPAALQYQLCGPFRIWKRGEFGIIKIVKCLKCDGKISTVLEENPSFFRERIYDAKTLKPGDHIAWFRKWGYWHHAIFINGAESKDEPTVSKLELIEFASNGTKITIHESQLDWHHGFDMFLFEYEECYSPEYTIQLARAATEHFKQDEEKLKMEYNLITDNCEHFARRCKAGKSASGQILDIKHEVTISLLRWMILLAVALSEVLVNESFVSCLPGNWVKMQRFASVMMMVFLAFILLVHEISRALKNIHVHYDKTEPGCKAGRMTLREFYTNYLTVVARIVVREFFATGLAVIFSFLYQHYWHEYIFGSSLASDVLEVFLSFVILVVVSTIGLAVGHIAGSYTEKFLLSLLRCFNAPSNSYRTIPGKVENDQLFPTNEKEDTELTPEKPVESHDM